MNQRTILLRWNHHLPLVHRDLLVYPRRGISPLQPFICCNARLVHIDIEETDAPVVSTISAVAAKAHGSSVAEPQRRLAVAVGAWHAVVVDVVTK